MVRFPGGKPPESCPATEEHRVSLQYQPIASLKPGTRIENTVFLMANWQLRPKRDGGQFVSMQLRDASGKITGVMWDSFEPLTDGGVGENDFVQVTAEVLTYQGQLQMRIQRISRVDESAVDSKHFLPVSPVSAEEMDRQFAQFVGQITDSDYRALVDSIFSTPALMDRFRRAPSAVSMHQAYLGGLMEHTFCVLRNALKIADNYPTANRSLLICAGLLHDVGKTMEFTFDKKIAYSDAGRLLGHISMGNALVEVHCSRIPGFPLAKKVLVQHIILSHHGYYEFGSPKRPKTLEALIMHHADIVDAQLSNYVEFAEKAENGGARWEYSAMFERYIFAPTEGEVKGSELMRALVYAAVPPPLAESQASPNIGEDLVSSDDLLRSLGADLPEKP